MKFILQTPSLTRAAAAALFALSTVACGGGGESTETSSAGEGAVEERRSLVVYSGRAESLVAPLFETFTAATGIEVQARYGSTSEMAATVMEEGANTPADLFFSQDAGALGALAAEGRLKALPAEVLERVPSRFASPEGQWVGVSGRARSVVYNPQRIQPEDLPKSLEALTDERYKGRFGVAPANGSFQAHMAVYSVVEGADELEKLLAGLTANEPQRYPKNSAIVEAVIRGEVDFGLVNHYYLWRALSESPDAPGINFYMSEGAASGFVNLAGVGVLSDNPAAVELARFLLSAEGQGYFANETFEYPLVDGIEPSSELTPLADLATPEVDFGRVSAALPATLQAINGSGLLQ